MEVRIPANGYKLAGKAILPPGAIYDVSFDLDPANMASKVSIRWGSGSSYSYLKCESKEISAKE